MHKSELNRFIADYVNDRKNDMAIMVTGPWGCGKSYYIKNELTPFLREETKYDNPCIVVSLYGMKDVEEIGKTIFLDASLINRNLKDKEGKRVSAGKKAGLLAARTLIKTVSLHFGIDISKEKNDLIEICNTLNLGKRLIILEDIERSRIDIETLMGYINSLTEQDFIKLMIVANEDELIRYNRDANAQDPDGRDPFDYTESTKFYLESKNKTVSDTIQFEPDVVPTLMTIIGSYDRLQRYADRQNAEEIGGIMQAHGVLNFRMIEYACKRTAELFKMIEGEEYPDDFYKTVFLGVILYSIATKGGRPAAWEGTDHLSASLGSYEYPLFRFCYDYINSHSFDRGSVKRQFEALKRYRLRDKRCTYTDADFRTLRHYDTCDEGEVLAALESIEKRLSDTNDIPLSDYGMLSLMLFDVKRALGVDTRPIKNIMIENLRTRCENVHEELDLKVLEYYPDIEKRRIEQLKALLVESLADVPLIIPGFDYCPERIARLESFAERNRGFLLEYGRFASKLDPDKFIGMLKACDAEQLARVRAVFTKLYLDRGKTEQNRLSADIEAIARLREKVKELIGSEGLDKIRALQRVRFADELEDIQKALN